VGALRIRAVGAARALCHSDRQTRARAQTWDRECSAKHDASSAQLRDQLLTDIGNLANGDEVVLWAHRRLKEKNRLNANDAEHVEESFRHRLVGLDGAAAHDTVTSAAETQSEALEQLRLRVMVARGNSSHRYRKV